MTITNQKLADLYKIDTNIFNTDELIKCKVNILIEIAQEKLIDLGKIKTTIGELC